MNDKWSLRADYPKTTPLGLTQLILTLVGWGVGLVILLFTSWATIPVWTQYLIIGFICLSFGVTLVLGIIPATRLFTGWIHSLKRTRQQQRSFRKLTDIVQDAQFLFAPHSTYSLGHYVDSLCNALVQSKTLHPEVKRLSERLHILSDWHESLLTLTSIGFKRKELVTRIVGDMTLFYRDVAEVVRELAATKLPDDGSLVAHNDQRRMTEEKYNQHIERLEQALEELRKSIPEVNSGIFYRF